MRELCKRPRSARELAKLTGLRIMTVYDYLKQLHKSPYNLVHIVDYRKGKKGGPTALWMFGYCQTDAIRPPKQSKEEKNRKLRIKYQTQRDSQKGITQHVSN